MITHIS